MQRIQRRCRFPKRKVAVENGCGDWQRVLFGGSERRSELVKVREKSPVAQSAVEGSRRSLLRRAAEALAERAAEAGVRDAVEEEVERGVQRLAELGHLVEAELLRGRQQRRVVLLHAERHLNRVHRRQDRHGQLEQQERADHTHLQRAVHLTAPAYAGTTLWPPQSQSQVRTRPRASDKRSPLVNDYCTANCTCAPESPLSSGLHSRAPAARDSARAPGVLQLRLARRPLPRRRRRARAPAGAWRPPAPCDCRRPRSACARPPRCRCLQHRLLRARSPASAAAPAASRVAAPRSGRRSSCMHAREAADIAAVAMPYEIRINHIIFIMNRIAEVIFCSSRNDDAHQPRSTDYVLHL